VRELYQGVLQVGVGFYHLERGNYRGTVLSITRGLDRLRRLAPVCQGIDVKRLIVDTALALQEIHELGGSRLAEFDERHIPRIAWNQNARGAAGWLPPESEIYGGIDG